jgi:hypothetical protein
MNGFTLMRMKGTAARMRWQQSSSTSFLCLPWAAAIRCCPSLNLQPTAYSLRSASNG